MLGCNCRHLLRETEETGGEEPHHPAGARGRDNQRCQGAGSCRRDQVSHRMTLPFRTPLSAKIMFTSDQVSLNSPELSNELCSRTTKHPWPIKRQQKLAMASGTAAAGGASVPRPPNPISCKPCNKSPYETVHNADQHFRCECTMSWWLVIVPSGRPSSLPKCRNVVLTRK